MQIAELIIIIFICLFIFLYRKSPGNTPYKYMSELAGSLYDRYAPFSYKAIREKVHDLGQNYSAKQYGIQLLLFGGVAGAISFAYFYSILWAIVYAGIAMVFVPIVNYLKYKRIYNEFIFESIQTYCTNVIQEFGTTQSFVKSLEGVRDSGILDEPILSDVKVMIDMSYTNGTIDESLKYMTDKYPYYMVRNMHQLFLQITNEGAKDSGESLENMMADIDTLVEGVYRDKMDRAQFYRKFITFGMALYLLVILMQLLLGRASYLEMIQKFYVQIILHGIIIVNSYFLFNGTKFYNEDIGAE